MSGKDLLEVNGVLDKLLQKESEAAGPLKQAISHLGSLAAKVEGALKTQPALHLDEAEHPGVHDLLELLSGFSSNVTGSAPSEDASRLINHMREQYSRSEQEAHQEYEGLIQNIIQQLQQAVQNMTASMSEFQALAKAGELASLCLCTVELLPTPHH